jgi:hypothetical protein
LKDHSAKVHQQISKSIISTLAEIGLKDQSAKVHQQISTSEISTSFIVRPLTLLRIPLKVHEYSQCSVTQ